MGTDLVLVVGPSGAGIRTTIAILEDLFGYAAMTKVDPRTLVNLVRMLPDLDKDRWKKLALHVGMRRMSGEDLFREHSKEQYSFVSDCVQAFKDLRKEHPAFKIVFLYCSQSQLEGRQDYGFHPLKSACGSISAAIFKECEIIVNLFGELCADFMDDLIFIDSSHPKPRGIQTVKAALDRGLKQGSAGSNFSDPHLKDLRAQLCTRGWNQMQATLSQVREMVAIINREFKARGHGVVKTRLNCLLLGESGTGKERIAKILHSDSEEGTTAKPQVVIDCTAIPHGLIESELFGCVKGAFTGATNRKGQVESADGGVIFLDEIGLVDKSSQAKLLRLIEERQYRKVGEDGPPHTVDCRIIAATSRNLAEEVKNGSFLRDLYERLDGVSILVPPLRERREDIPVLLGHYAAAQRFSLEAMTVLFDYEWPGNARELRNVAHKCSLVEAERVKIADLPLKITERYKGILEYAEHAKEMGFGTNVDTIVDRNEIARQVLKERIGDEVWFKEQKDAARKQKIIEALEKSRGNKTRAALDLGIKRSQLHRDIRRLGIETKP